MFIDIAEYIKLPIECRQKHLKLEDSCIEIGGDSRLFRGLLAHHLKTTISHSEKHGRILVCHACHNSKCSNPDHLYWGTDSDNTKDSMKNGTYLNFKDRYINKYGLDAYIQHMKIVGSKGGKAKRKILLKTPIGIGMNQ